MRPVVWACLLAAALLGAPAALGGKPKMVDEHAAGGGVAADFFYLETGAAPANGGYGAFRIRIMRSGTVAFFDDIVCRFCMPFGRGKPPKAVHVVRLAPGEEPVVIVDLDTGGAHCCETSEIYEWTGTAYRRIEQDWGDPAYGLSDLRRDGTIDFVTADDRFAYEFTDYAHSLMPIRIWQLESGSLLDVTRAFRPEVQRDAARMWHWYAVGRRSDDGVRGALAAWAGDEALLGRWAAARAVLASPPVATTIRHDTTEPGNGDAPFLVHLERFLAKNGYLG